MGTQPRPKGIRVRFAYANEDEFVKTYCYYCEDEAVFAPTEKVITPNSECAFSLELTDGTPMLRGLGVVLDCWTNDDNRFGRRGVYIGFSQLTTSSEAIHARLLALRKLEEEENTEVTQIPVSPRTRNAPQTQQQWGTRVARKSAEIAVPDVEETDAGEMRKSITQEMRAASESGLLAAVPTAIEEKTHNATARYEGPIRGPAMPAKRAPSPLAAVAPPKSKTREETVPQLPSALKQPTTAPMHAVVPPTSSAGVSTAPMPSTPASSKTGAATAPMHATSSSESNERPSAPALPPIPALRPLGSTPIPPAQVARGSMPAPIQDSAAASTSTAIPDPADEKSITTEPIAMVSGNWQDRVSQIRERAHVAAQKAWRRAQDTASSGWQTVRSEADQWRANPRTAAQRWKPTRRGIAIFAGGIVFGLILSLVFRSTPNTPPKVAAMSSQPPSNRIAALFTNPPAAKCDDTKPDAVAMLESPPADAAHTQQGSSKAGSIAKPATTKGATKPAAKAQTTKPTTIAKVTTSPTTATTKPAPTAKAVAPTTTKPPTIAKSTPTTTTKPATIAKAAPATTTTSKPATVAKAAPTTTTKPTTVAKTAPAPTTTAKPTIAAKTAVPTTTTAKPATVAKTGAAPPTTTAKPATVAKTASAPTTTTAKPTTLAKTPSATTTAKPTTVPKTAAAATTTTKPATQPTTKTTAPVQTKTVQTTKTTTAKKPTKVCGLDCI